MRKPSFCRFHAHASAIWLNLASCAACLGVAFSLAPNLGGTTKTSQRSSYEQPPSARQLSFADRIAYQEAIDKVYWRHQVWPDANSKPKPSFDQVICRAQLEKKVGDYLRNSKALEDYWHRPIDAKQLQAEMDRMAKQSKQPEMLRELFAALGNDPLVIAECLVRPILADRLATDFYAYDDRLHGQLRRRAEDELQMHPAAAGARETTGRYREIEWIKSDDANGTSDRKTRTGVRIDSREWDEAINRVEATVAGNAPGVMSSLQEDEHRFYATALLEKGNDYLRLAVIEWPKEPFESWKERAEPLTNSIRTSGWDYSLPAVSEAVTGAVDDTWSPTALTVPDRSNHIAIWTGTEMIVWGGDAGGGENTGGKYTPSTNTWTPITNVNGPASGSVGIWTGSEMIVWSDGVGGRYNPVADTWTTMSTVNAPASGFSAVWTGSEMIVWGDDSGVGGRYNPVADTWTLTSAVNAPAARTNHTTVWTGTEMIVWGGEDANGYLSTGGRYNPVIDSWITTNTAGAPSARSFHSAVWTGSAMIVWGGFDGQVLNDGGRYDPVTDSWAVTSSVGAPSARLKQTAVWTGSEMIVWAGYISNGINTGGRYNPGTDSWTPTNNVNAPSARWLHTAVWTGSEMIVWGGRKFDPLGHLVISHTMGRYRPDDDSWIVTGFGPSLAVDGCSVWTGSEMIIWGGADSNNSAVNSGGRYRPSTDSWAGTATFNAPTERQHHSAVWTGNEMVVWGGYYYDGVPIASNTGGRYDPMADSWATTTTINAPVDRYDHSAVWTGTEMVIWGGDNAQQGISFNSGGRYDPAANSWSSMSTTTSPIARHNHVSVWSGKEVIVWGGYPHDSTAFLHSGGRYNPETDSWVSISSSGPGSGATGVWTGDQMIVWGGDFFGGVSNSGGRYDPVSNSWTLTNLVGAPSARAGHTAIWTGNEMVVWGGATNTGGRYDPLTNAWLSTSTFNSPSLRSGHVAAWTGNEMLVWGGSDSSSHYLNTGGRYVAQSGAPTPTPTPAPTPTPIPTPEPTATATPSPVPALSISGAIHYCPNSTPSPVSNVLLALSGTSSTSTLSNSSGNYLFSSLPAGGTYVVAPSKPALPPTSAGINTSDSVAARQHYLHVITLTGCSLLAADVNGDGVVNTSDSIAIQRFFTGYTVGTANVGQYRFNPASRSYPGITTDQTGQDYDALILGDVVSPYADP